MPSAGRTVRGFSLRTCATSLAYFLLQSFLFLLLINNLLLPKLAQAQTELINSNAVIVGHVNSCPATGIPNTYACALERDLTLYVPRACYSFTANAANTAAATLNLNGIGARTIKKVQGGITTDLVANDIRPGQIVQVCYDGTNMQMVSPVGNAGGGAGTPAGSPGHVQWNQAGAFAGSAGLTVDGNAVLTRTDHVTEDSAGLALGAHNVIACLPGGADRTYTLPLAATTAVGSYQVVKLDTGTGACLILPSGDDTINGVSGPVRVASYLQQASLTRVGAAAWLAVSALPGGVRASTETTATLSAADVGKLVTLNNAAPIVVTIPAATQAGFGLGATLALRNLGSGAATLVAGASALDGTTPFVLAPGAQVTLWSDGTQYWSQPGFANPMTTAGDLVGGAGSGAAQRIAAGTPKQVLLAGTPPAFSSFPAVTYLPAARCLNNVASSQWSTGATPAAACRAGTHNHEGYLTWGAADTAEVSLGLPLDWDGALAPAVTLHLASTTTTAGQTIQMQVASACAKGDGTTTDDVAWNAVQNMLLVTTNATANQTWRTTLAALTMTNCSAGGLLRVKVSRTADTATNVRLYGMGMTIPRLPTVQAN
jgi:hypothetical protein